MRKAILIHLFVFCSFLIHFSALASTYYLYTGQELDKSTELYYFEQRYYDPKIGRFNRPDPMQNNIVNQGQDFLSNPQHLNAYSYTLNNPIIYIDPLGLLATEYDMPEGGWKYGDPMGDLNGVVINYNGVNIYNTKYSCVDYAKDYMSQKYGINDIGSVTNPKTWWGMLETVNGRLEDAGSEYRFKQYINGEGFNLPQEGDLLIWTQGGGGNGHVMVVSEANFDDLTGIGSVEVAHQNYLNDPVTNFSISKNENGYSILQKNGTPMAGWYRPVKNVTPSPSNPTSLIAPSPQPQQNWWQRAWTTTKNLWNKYF